LAITGQKRGNRRQESVLKAAARSTQQRRLRRRRLVALLLILAGVPAVAFGLAWGGRLAWRALLSENDFFLIQHIEVTTDGTMGRGHVLEYARVSTGTNLFAVHPRRIREALRSVPVVADVQVGRRWPDTLLIEVSERRAVARLGQPETGGILAVDSQGHVLGPSSLRPGLPAILGVRDRGLRPGDRVQDALLQDALRVLLVATRPDLRHEIPVETIDLRDPDALCVGLATGEQIQLSRDRIEEKLIYFPTMRDLARRRGLTLAVYDLTVDRNFVGRPANWHDPVGAVPR